MPKKPKIVTDVSERNMVERKVRVVLDGPVGSGGQPIEIDGWVVAQYVESGTTEETTVIYLAVTGPIRGV